MAKDIIASKEYTLIRCLLDDNLDPNGVWLAHNIIPHAVPLGKGVSAFVYRSRKGFIHIFMNSHLSNNRKIKTLCHELKHIIEDMPNMGRMVGIDMQQQPFEIEADQFIQEVAANYIND